MSLSDKIIAHDEAISVVGLGYVGMPIAVAFARKVRVIGFDINPDKVNIYISGKDPIQEVGDKAIQESTVEFTSEEAKLQEARFHIIAVPTPVNLDKTPDLTPVEGASRIVGRNLKKGSIVVYESTVYPGVTENICVPILEKESGLVCGIDFKVGYSPERINPGDKVHRLENIRKIVSGMDKESLENISRVYELIIEAGVVPVSSIKVAEAAKVVENSQRDINIAFMNELAMVFDRMDIDTKEVVEAMQSKWNALGFYPGLVGGHCIGVDPYYFIYEAERLGYHSQIVLAGRKINDGMGNFVAENIIKRLVLAGKQVREAKVVILGVTFKENCPDIRNSKVEDIIIKLQEYGITPIVSDPVADAKEVSEKYNTSLIPLKDITDADCLVFAVAHDAFKALSFAEINEFFIKGNNAQKVIIDVKSILDKEEFVEKGYQFWRL
ncbi:UDP-N-acetyl-D-galactosamine dehydrogenase [Anaerocolumna cellulosilytica]|uniref:UDP-N-acetyl-D-galactosamine dehydrogenase n=1 Tax=Anaerocolumna cellulosilytica TaxID=433286 RepID=A0A6S6R5E9_9FIRM|nr:nucleotide sugar dehydrogenase [Anaerocolumna cellulosilytica]MBB5194113.1 UDP-N-acetyl-D-galactosamine dehydrogenase [Anaerocolumna cellulosilytica]BCJ94672.1 UDP-N-acetyl-D-galactosamine dehydrogenase [Anaerocolumna cellulosilytica]